MKPAEQSQPAGSKSTRSVKTTLMQGAFIFAVWVLLSGKLTPFHLSVGFASTLLLLWLDRRLDSMADEGSIRFHPFRWIIYAAWLIGQILLGAIHVAMVIIRPSRHLKPRLIRVRMPQPNIFASAALANSITVTPGTLTIDVVDDVFEVHVLTDRTAEGLLSGTMPERVARLFADTAPPPPMVITEETTEAPPLPEDRA